MLKPDRFSCSQKIQLKQDPPVLPWSGNHGIEICNSWGFKDTQDDKLDDYWR